VVDLPAQNLQ